MVTWTLRWQGPHKTTVRPGSRRLSCCLLFLLRFIFLARERGRRWWRVRRSSPRHLLHSWHLPPAPSSRFSSLGTTPRLYGLSTRAAPAGAFPARLQDRFWVMNCSAAYKLEVSSSAEPLASKRLITAWKGCSPKLGCAELGALPFLVILLARERVGVLLDHGSIVILGGFYDGLPGSAPGAEGCH
jgi:hypothetical protein